MNPRKLLYVDGGLIVDTANMCRGPALEPVETPVAQMGQMQPEERHALGSKFAASLEMYEALKGWHKFSDHLETCDTCFDSGECCPTGKTIWNEALKASRAALSKAEGRE